MQMGWAVRGKVCVDYSKEVVMLQANCHSERAFQTQHCEEQQKVRHCLTILRRVFWPSGIYTLLGPKNHPNLVV